MITFKNLAIVLIGLAGVISIVSCSSMMPIQAYSIQTATAPSSTSQDTGLMLLNLGEPATQPYAVLGKVMAFKRGGLGATRELNYISKPPADLVAALRDPAQGLGADAIVGIYHGEYRGVSSAGEYVSGLAVAYTHAGTGAAQGRSNLRVGVLPVQTGKSKIDADDYAEIDRDFRVGSRWLLENKGYYAPIDTNVKFTGNVAALLTMNSQDLEQLYGTDTELLLVIELLDEQSFTPVLLEQRKVVVKATLFSKSLKKAIWENQVEKEQVTGVFWLWMSTAMARSSAIESVLQPMPFFMRTSGKEFTGYQPDMIKKMVPAK